MELQFSLCDHFSVEKPYTLFQAVLREDAEDLAAAVADHPGLVVADLPGKTVLERVGRIARQEVAEGHISDRDTTVVTAIITVLSSSSLPSVMLPSPMHTIIQAAPLPLSSPLLLLSLSLLSPMPP